MSIPSKNDYENLLAECKIALKSLQNAEPGDRQPITAANALIADIDKLLDNGDYFSGAFTLSETEDEVWVKAEDLNTRVYRTEEGVVCDIWKEVDDESEPVASTYEFFERD